MTDLWQRANAIMPGGNSLFSKTPDRYCPGRWPPYYKTAHGITIETPDGKWYQDFSVMGAGNSVLGYADNDVDDAVQRVIYDGNVSTLNPVEEVELAEVMLKLNPKMDMVRFGRSGNDACQIALRIAREYSGKRQFAICGYHGWQIGHPPQLDPECLPFEYGDVDAADHVFTDDLGAVMMEPVRTRALDLEFLKFIRGECDRLNIPLIFDEVASGFRCNLGGYHQKVNLYPDIVTYGKAMGNGHAISAIVGKREFMEKARNTFISSMLWSERSGYAAGLATIEKMRETDAQSQIMETGKAVKNIWKRAATASGLRIDVSGLDPLATFGFVGDEDREIITTFTQEMLKRGYLASGQFYASICHRPALVGEYGDHVAEVFADIASGKAVLEGEPARPGFTRLA